MSNGKPVCHIQDGTVVLFECPGCNFLHSIATQDLVGERPKWQFNGDVVKPTISPSILVRYNYTSQSRWDAVCHSFVTDGRIQFLTDCTHKLAGQTVDLPPWDEEPENSANVG